MKVPSILKFVSAAVVAGVCEQGYGRAFADQDGVTDLPGAVSMIWTGQETLVETTGYADLETKRPISTNDLFWIASNTKAIACALMLRQVDKGLVGLDRPVGAGPQATPEANAKAVQQAIDDCASTGGEGVVTIPKGVEGPLPVVRKPRVRIVYADRP